MALLIKADNEQAIQTVSPANGEFSLEELQGFVGGYVEIVRRGALLPRELAMVVNEEGRMAHMRLPYNERASFIAGQTIVGDVIICQFGTEIS